MAATRAITFYRSILRWLATLASLWIVCSLTGGSKPSLAAAVQPPAGPASAPRWKQLIPPNELEGDIRKTLIDSQGKIYVLGSFFIRQNVLSNVAAWDGQHWQSLLEGEYDPIHLNWAPTDKKMIDIALDANGMLFATYSSIGQPYLKVVKQWKNQVWIDLNFPTNRCANDGNGFFAFGSGQLYVRCSNTDNNDTHLKWNGSAWSDAPLPAGYYSNLLNVDSQGRIYLYLSDPSGLSQIHYWDGNLWKIIGQPNGGVDQLLLTKNGLAYVLGSFTQIDGVAVDGLARWDGRTWSQVGTGFTGRLFQIAADSQQEPVYGITCSSYANSTCGAQVDLVRLDGAQSNWVASWQGKAGLAAGAGSVYLTGSLLNTQDALFRSISRWENGRLQLIGQAGLGRSIDSHYAAIAPGKNGNAYLYASFVLTSTQTITTGVGEWNGQNWTPLIGSGNFISSKSLVSDSQGRLYAIGQISNTLDTNNVIARWNGQDWQPLGGPFSGWVNSMKVDSQDRLIAGGYFTRTGTVAAQNIARWDGQHWAPLGSGITTNVFAVAADRQDRVYVVSYKFIKRWDGQAWSQLADVNYGQYLIKAWKYPQDLEVDARGGVIVTAWDEHISVPGYRLFTTDRWDGAQWSTFLDTQYFNLNEDFPTQSITADRHGNLYTASARWDGTRWMSLRSFYDWNAVSHFDLVSVDHQGTLLIGNKGNTSNHGALLRDVFYPLLTSLPTAPQVKDLAFSITPSSALLLPAQAFAPAYSPLTGTLPMTVTIVSLPQHGALKLSGVAVSAGQAISQTQLAGLVYAPQAGYLGQDDFLWTASDGVWDAPTPATAYIRVANLTKAFLSLLVR